MPQGAGRPAALPAIPAEGRGLFRVSPVVQRQSRLVTGRLGTLEREVARVEPLVPDETSQICVGTLA